MNIRYREVVLALAVAGNFSLLGSRLLVSPAVPDVIASFGVSKAEMGLALTGMWAAYALVQFPGGVLGDRYGERALVVAAFVCSGVGSLALAVAPSFALFSASAIFLGAGAGLYFPSATALLAKLFRNTGRALSLHTAGGSLAGLVAPAAAGYLVVRHGWRTAVVVGPAAVLPVAALVVWRVRPTPPARPEVPVRSRFDAAAVRELLGRPAVAYTTLVALATTFAWQAFASFFPTFLIEHRGLAVETAGLGFGAVFLLSAVAQPAMGALSDTTDRDAALAASLLCAAAGLSVLVATSGGPATVAGIGLLGVGLSWAGVLQARFMDQFTDAERASGFGLVRTVYMLVGSVGSLVTGALAGAAGWPVAFGLVAGLLLATAASLAVNRALGLGL